MPYVLVRHKVADFSKWKTVYDAHLPARKEAGVIKEVHLLRNADGSVRTLGYCSDYRKPVLHLAGALFTISEAALFLTAFLRRYRIGRLNVAGPQRSQDLFAGKFARSVLDVTFGFTLGQEQARRGL